MSRSLVWLALAALAGGTAACAKPDCEKSVAHTFKILEEDAARMSAPEKSAVQAALPRQKEEALAECKSGKPRPLTMARQKCILASKTKPELERCAN